MNARKHVGDEISCMAFYGRSDCLNTHVQYEKLAASLQGSWKGLAVPCSTSLSGCFQFSNFKFFFLPKNLWLLARVYSDLVVIYFVNILHVTCSTLKLVMYS